MSQSWNQLERDGARLIQGQRYAASPGGPVDAEGPRFVLDAKYRQRVSVTEIEQWAVAIAAAGAECCKVGVLLCKRKAEADRTTPALVILTNAAWRAMTQPMEAR